MGYISFGVTSLSEYEIAKYQGKLGPTKPVSNLSAL
jgi:hypothetical protein